MGDIVDLVETAEWRERKKRMHKVARVTTRIPNDLFFEKEGTVTRVGRVKEGEHDGKFVYSLQFPLERGYAVQSYFRGEITFFP